MARYRRRIDVPSPPEAVFDDLARFENTAEWDPGIARAERRDAGPVRVGSRFRVVATFLGREIPFDYEVVELEPGERIVLVGEAPDLVSRDEIRVRPEDDGSEITWDARLTLSGWRRLLDPALDLAFLWIGSRAIHGLRERFAQSDDRAA